MIQLNNFRAPRKQLMKGQVKPLNQKSIYVYQYKLFKILPGESIKDMYILFSGTINNLKSFEKIYTKEEMVRKVM